MRFITATVPHKNGQKDKNKNGKPSKKRQKRTKEKRNESASIYFEHMALRRYVFLFILNLPNIMKQIINHSTEKARKRHCPKLNV